MKGKKKKKFSSKIKRPEPSKVKKEESKGKSDTKKKSNSKFSRFSEKLFDVYENDYKRLMIFPFGLLFFFIGVMIFSQITTGEIIQRDITLKGGTSITIYTHEQLSLSDIENSMAYEFGTSDVVARRLMDATQQNVLGYDIQIGLELNNSEVYSSLGNAIGIELDSDNTNIAIQSSTIAESFFQDAVVVIAIAFVLMSLVVFYYFRSPIPAGSIILSTVSDIICVLGLMSLLDVKLSIATIGAFLMIIGYSTDSDILLATYILKRKDGSLMERIKHGIKIELTVDTASYVVYFIMFVLSNIEIIKHIAFIMLFATMFDVINTWIQNAGLQRIYLERRDKR